MPVHPNRTRKFIRVAVISASFVAAAAIALAGTAPGAGALAQPHCWFSISKDALHPTPKCGAPPKPWPVESFSSSLNPAAAGQAVTFTVTVQSGTGVGQPTGTVLFESIDEATQNRTGITTVPLTNGVATWTTSTLPVGSNSLEAEYSGDFNWNGTFALVYQQINPALPAITSISPKQGPVGGGTKVTVKGVNFAGVTGISVGGTAAASFRCPTTTKCTLMTPPGAKGKDDIEVTAATGTSAAVAADVFKYVVVAS